jgi:outer membrane protein insertion porin family
VSASPSSRSRPPRAFRRSASLTLALLAGGVLALPTLAQSEPATDPSAPITLTPELEALEGRPVRLIVLETISYPTPAPGEKTDPKAPPPTPIFGTVDATTEQLVRNNIRLREGNPYYADIVRSDIVRLNRLGRFRRVDAKAQPLDDGSVVVRFQFLLQPVIQAVQTVGNRRFSDEEILKAIDVLIGTPVDNTQLDRFCRRIEDTYKAKGYYNAQVLVDQDELEKTGVVLFRIREGNRLRVTDIRFEGNLSFSPRELKKGLKTEESYLFNTAQLDEDFLAQDVATISQFYKDRGYLDSRVDRLVRPSPDNKEGQVTFVIFEGPIYTLRSVKAEYAKDDPTTERIFTPEQMLGLMLIKPGDVYSDDKLRKSIDALNEAYLKMGYVDARVVRRELLDPSEPKVDILLVVRQGARFRTGEVIIRGNDLTRSEVIRREVRFQPDRPLDATQKKRTEDLLRQSRLFNVDPASDSIQPTVTVQPPDPGEPEHRDVLVEIAETNTGSFNIGGAVSSDGGVTAIFTIKQDNFDVQDTPDSFGELFSGGAFRGAGQKFKVEALPGDRRQAFGISLSEPALFDTNYSGSIALQASRRDYRQYTEVKYGAGFGFGRRFGDRWIGSLPIRIENISLQDIETSAPVDYFDVRDPSYFSSVGLTLQRTTVDNRFRPSKGTNLEFGLEQAGALGGDFQYTSLRAEHNLFLPLDENIYGAKTVLSFKTRASFIPQDTSDVPVYERFYLGGQNFRGFDFRGISPRGIRNDTGTLGSDPVGGNFMFFWGTEYKLPVYEDLLAIVFFLDTGTVNQELSLANYRASVGFGFRIFVEGLSPVPLSFDFGFPIKKESDDDLRLFTFGIDLPFF